MNTLLLKTRYPCCGGQCKILAHTDVPREVYDRTCPQCGGPWEVERRAAGLAGPNRRVDVLEWTPVNSRVRSTVVSNA